MKKPVLKMITLATLMSPVALAMSPQLEAKKLAENLNGQYTLVESSGDYAKQYCVDTMQLVVVDTGVEVVATSDKDAPIAITYNREAPPVKEGLVPVRRGAFDELSMRERQDSMVRSIQLDLTTGKLTKRSFGPMSDLYSCIYQKITK